MRLGGSVFVMPKACKHKKEAWEFMSWICGPYACRTFCREINNIPPLIEAAKAPEFQKSSLTRDAIKLAGGKNAFGPAPIVVWPLYQREMQRAEDKATHGAADPKALLENVQKATQRELDEAKRYAVY